ncbi:MAG: hypothetical protein ACRCZF_20845 [Gemmataceae bacterium]
MIAILFALEREAKLFIKGLGGVPPGCLITHTGLGPVAARLRTQELLAAHTITKIIVAGVCGGLRPGLKIGDIIVPIEVLELNTIALSCAPILGLPEGRMLTVAEMALAQVEKSHHRETTGADAIDMEAAAVAAVAIVAGIPVAVAKAVIDPAEATLPAEIRHFYIDGEVKKFRLFWSLLKRPALGAELKQLGDNVTRAMAALVVYLEEYLPKVERQN